MPPADDGASTMNRNATVPTQATITDALRCLGHPRRRRILVALDDLSATVTVGELADELRGPGTTEDRSDGRERLHRSLRRVHLPHLSQATLVDWKEADDVVSLADVPFWNDEWFRRLREASPDRSDPVSNVWGDERRHATLAVLAYREGSMTRHALAYAVLDRRADGEISTAAIEESAVELHHHHLPRLERAGVVEYDAETGVAVAVMDADPAVDDAVDPKETRHESGA